MNCGSSHGGAAAKELSVGSVCNTLLYLLYDHARLDEEKLKRLKDCNKVFAVSEKKEKARSRAISNVNSAEHLPEFADAFADIATLLDANIVVALDEVDCLDKHDQRELMKKLQGILIPSKATKLGHRSVKLLVGCPIDAKFYDQIEAIKNMLYSVNVSDCNHDDMRNMLKDALKDIPGLTQVEQEAAVNAILERAGSQFAYINAIAIPFMREPFQRPLSDRLRELPEGMKSVYHDALQKMGPSYIKLLETVLLWSLLAPVPLRLGEIMDAYQGTYRERGPHVEKEAIALDDGRFPKSSTLEIEQLQDARGPFLRLESESWSGQYLVHLQDPSQIRDFCISTSVAPPQNEDAKAHLCTSCKSAKVGTDNLTISKKHGHLRLALECMRTMNNAVFQRRSTSEDERPLWSQSGLPTNTPENKVVSQKNGNNDSTMKKEPDKKRKTLRNINAARDPHRRQAGQHKLNRSVDISQASSSDACALGKGKGPRIGKSMEEVTKDNEGEEREGPEDKKTRENPNESQDDEDRGEINLTHIPDTNKHKEKYNDPDLRMYRYEMGFWHYHILQAESEWSLVERSESSAWADLFDELDFWVTQNAAWFKRWQLSDTTLANYQGYLDPLHVAAYLGLTSWVTHLLNKGAQINATTLRVQKTPLQVAADRVNSLEMLRLLLERRADPNTSIDSTPACEKYLSDFQS